MIYGKDCPKGKVQIEFVGCAPALKQSDYSWLPTDSAFVEIYVDGDRYRIQVGNFHDGHAERRGLHIVGPLTLLCEKTSLNACSIWKGEEE